MMQNILLLEDNIDSQRDLSEALKSSYSIYAVATVKQAVEELQRNVFAAVLLKLSVTDGDGFQVLGFLKALEPQCLPVVFFLSEEGDLKRKLMAFAMGADDYLVRPFEFLELKARLESRLQKTLRIRAEGESFIKGEISFQISSYQASIGGAAPLKLTPIEFRLFLHFAQHEDQIFTRDQLIRALWGNVAEIFDRTIDAHISKLRKKIIESQFEIVPLRGLGYKFARKEAQSSDKYQRKKAA